jgi:hypothetical protein
MLIRPPAERPEEFALRLQSVGVSSSTSTLCIFPLTLMVKAMTSSPFLPMAIGGAIRRRFRYSKHGCNQTRSVEANLLDDGIDDTLASVGATIALLRVS